MIAQRSEGRVVQPTDQDVVARQHVTLNEVHELFVVGRRIDGVDVRESVPDGLGSNLIDDVRFARPA